ncbi:MAG: hypothetical protein JOS17DRAFT_589876 [Linnemannia elongata]|nr:MAG: hypothetical protein JOS17DRAFT_589876 [Linnemannia elongata]
MFCISVHHSILFMLAPFFLSLPLLLSLPRSLFCYLRCSFLPGLYSLHLSICPAIFRPDSLVFLSSSFLPLPPPPSRFLSHLFLLTFFPSASFFFFPPSLL